MQVTARYDGHADWYDGWARSAGAEVMAVARAALGELLPSGPGQAVDIGCGTGVHAEFMRDRGFRVVGLDYSADQLRLARGRLPVARADARALPLRSGSVSLVFSMFTHTDLDGFDRLVAEAVRVLEPGEHWSTRGFTRASSARSSNGCPTASACTPGTRRSAGRRGRRTPAMRSGTGSVCITFHWKLSWTRFCIRRRDWIGSSSGAAARCPR
jgi:ubiquinone/menaquinone biosynthesis C-methylase UbiE